MLNKIKKIDTFAKNIIIVFAGTSFANFLNFLFQPLVAHSLSASDFSAFRSLISIFTVISAPLVAIQLTLAKYISEFNARSQIVKIRFLLSDFFKKTFILAIATFLLFWLVSVNIMNALKISSASSVYLLAILVALAWISPVLSGGIQGLEFFGWWTSVSVLSGILKLILAFWFLLLGYNIGGALGALLVSSLMGIFIFYFPLRQNFTLKTLKEDINYKQILIYLLPVAISHFCFFGMVNFDMILVRRFFTPQYSGFYSLAQLIGNIFLFLPAAISTVMLPRTSGLNAKNMDSFSTLKRSLLYVFSLCILAFLAYNLFPDFILRILTGRTYPEPVFLGRLFSISMTFFALLYILIMYFLSIRDLRFLKYLIPFTIAEYLVINFLHNTLVQVQITLCINSILLFFVHLMLLRKNRQGLNWKLMAGN